MSNTQEEYKAAFEGFELSDFTKTFAALLQNCPHEYEDIRKILYDISAELLLRDCLRRIDESGLIRKQGRNSLTLLTNGRTKEERNAELLASRPGTEEPPSADCS
jgi:hypothetical protein